MSDKRVKMTIEFDIDEEALREHGLQAIDVFKGLTLREDEQGGFRIAASVPGRENGFFLCNGKVAGMEFVPEWVRGDGLDQWRRMVIDEIDVNSDVYGLSNEEKDVILKKDDVVDFLAERMETYMARGDRNEYQALEMAFQAHFADMVKDFRQEEVSDAILFSDVLFEDDSLLYGMDAPDEIRVFHDGNDNLYCQFADEDFVRPLRDRIQDVQEGDAFFWMNEGHIRIADEDAHQNFDEPDECWVVHDTDGEGYFEEDIGTDLGEKIRNLMKSLKPREVQERLEDQIRDAENLGQVDPEPPFVMEKDSFVR